MRPKRKAPGREKYGKQRGQTIVSWTHGVFSAHLPYVWGTKRPSMHAVLRGLSVSHWSKGWICDLSKTNQWTSLKVTFGCWKKAGIFPLELPSSYVNLGSWRPLYPTHKKHLSTKGVNEANPQREREGRDEGHRKPWWHHLSPWNQLWQSWGKTPGLCRYMGQ